MRNRLQVQLFLLDNLIWVIVVLFFLINAIVTPKFATYDNLVNIFYHSAIMSLLVLAQGLVMVIGHLDLSIESTLAFAPGIAMLLALKWIPGGLHPVLCIFLTLAVGALVGLFNGFCIAKIKVNPFLQSLSMLIMLRGLVLFLVPFSIFPLDEIYVYAGQARMAGNIPVAIPIVLVVFLIFHIILQYTPFGRYFVATGGNPRASFISGIDTRRVVIYAFVISGLLAAIAGLLAAGRQGSISNSMGQNMVLLSFAGAILGGASLEGGKGTPLGMLGGALLLGMISNSLNLLGVGVNLVYATQGALIFVAIVIDRLRVKFRGYLLHQEQVQKLLDREKQDPNLTATV
ncbi:MAG TPA: ABC transporter permease [Bacillota bacterium]|jgi:simple sugar transport system permease protein/ribose transport system permease protein|nr:ABC transporter permease [Peptococcaceae bacterium MAG4]NLW38618.1 ABC transporter permease [Peptococcaceae bacterium]HPZ43928.1 ABC transporter permease [Bacillota bacterium]HQD76416.1 ABC transporter permease [Bacillota bacterium]HUM59130.1 ABC transporter permease [Bacillota bacterium]